MMYVTYTYILQKIINQQIYINMFNPKQIPNHPNQEKWQTASTTTNQTSTPSFINQPINQWPNWRPPAKSPTQQPLQNQGFLNTWKRTIKPDYLGYVNEPTFQGIVYEKLDYVPMGSYIGRGPTRFYKYYVDPANDSVYFYSFQGYGRTDSQKIERKYAESQLLKDREYLYESVKIVPIEIYQASQDNFKNSVKKFFKKLIP